LRLERSGREYKKYRSGTSLFEMNHSLRSLFASQIIFRFAPSLVHLFCGSLVLGFSSVCSVCSVVKKQSSDVVVKKRFWNKKWGWDIFCLPHGDTLFGNRGEKV